MAANLLTNSIVFVNSFGLAKLRYPNCSIRGESYSYTFDKPGTYKYFCDLHPHMVGRVVVSP